MLFTGCVCRGNRGSEIEQRSGRHAEGDREAADVDEGDVALAVLDATPLNNYLTQPEHASIKCIVLCYGIPSGIVSGSAKCSVDSALPLLGNPGVLETVHWGCGGVNPYFLSRERFSKFRDSDANRIDKGSGVIWKLNYLVCRLEAFEEPKTTVTIGGQQADIPSDVKAMIDRSLAAAPGGKFVLDGTWADEIVQPLKDLGGRLERRSVGDRSPPRVEIRARRAHVHGRGAAPGEDQPGDLGPAVGPTSATPTKSTSADWALPSLRSQGS